MLLTEMKNAQGSFDDFVKRTEQLSEVLNFKIDRETRRFEEVRRYAAFRRFSHAAIALFDYLPARLDFTSEDLDKDDIFTMIIKTCRERKVFTLKQIEVLDELTDMIGELMWYDYDPVCEIDEDMFLEDVYEKHAFMTQFIASEVARLNMTNIESAAKQYER